MQHLYLLLLLLIPSILLGQTPIGVQEKEEIRQFILQIQGGAENAILPSSNDQVVFNGNYPVDNDKLLHKIDLGKVLFYDGETNCGLCHNPDFSGFPHINPAIGFGGIGNGPERVKDSLATEFDIQPVATKSQLNSGYNTTVLHDGSMGYGGRNADLPDSILAKHEVNFLQGDGTNTQSIVGVKVHRTFDIDACRNNPLINKSCEEVYGVPIIDEFIVGDAIATWEKSTDNIPYNAPYQRFLKGDLNAMTNLQIKGATIFFGKAQCNSCHYGPALTSDTFAQKTTKKPYEGVPGRSGFTKNPEDLWEVRTLQLYNLKDAKFLFWEGEYTTFSGGIKAHQKTLNLPNLTGSEHKALVDFVKNGLYDESIKDRMRFAGDHILEKYF